MRFACRRPYGYCHRPIAVAARGAVPATLFDGVIVSDEHVLRSESWDLSCWVSPWSNECVFAYSFRASQNPRPDIWDPIRLYESTAQRSPACSHIACHSD
ncbi:hypothetical protein BAUCODRAFT_275885 [Baudoinia panamericana UAMH 10762]|uniref:Uncharacterized protein n=1 Tax=Baudoinia panamericana (strain UAMH 10762) TaxID=717646 RepID=M2MZJ2_BAUPA|nr:uncharacterized protein BAUCODRAFT_275885 [Baudoinia panamericana UAMH 10762]EMC92084.1 hypothetical protein BAUCODRAFT_275885 [Baudoinia panamericana UAMH 10762]